MQTARAEYGSFLEDVDAGQVREETAVALEADLESEDRAYLALSSLAYGYYRLAQHAASQPSPSPVLTSRLDHWNALLSALYAGNADGSDLRRAVLAAALDLHERAPRVPTHCGDAAGELEECDSTGLLIWTLQNMDEQNQTHGIRGALSRLLDRFRGGEDQRQ
jgi:hypothetical protein